jgi:DNA polymerase-3 subunit epsilon
MTRGQNSLVIDANESSSGDLVIAPIDFSQFDLPVVAANDAEVAAHEVVLAELDKASGGKTAWRAHMA